jgi:hypothetical protein
MAQAAIGLGISTGLSLLGNSLKPVSRSYNEVNKSDSLILPKSGSGFTLSRIYGKKKIESCFIFWAVDKINRPTTSTQTSGSKKKGNRSSVTTTTNNYFYTFAVAVCDGSNNSVSEIKQIYFNGKIWYNAEGELEGTAQNNSFILSQHLEIYLGTSGQGKSPTIESYEGSRRTPPLKHTCYLVFKEIPESVVGTWPPTISVTIQGSKDNLYTTINDVCESAGLIESVHFHAGTVGNITVTGAEFKQDGGTYSDFLDELLQRHFVMARIANNGSYGDYNGAIQFLRQNDEGLTTHTLTADDLRAREVGSGEDIEPYKEIFEDALKLPSEVSVTAVDPNNKFKAISRSVIKHGLTHRNVLNINTNLAMTEGMCDELAYKKLKQAWIERREYEEITLLPHWLDAGMIAGDKLVLPLESGDNVTLQITEINIGANFLLNIKAKAFEEDLFTQVPTREFSNIVTASTTIQLPQTNLVSFTSLTNADGTVEYEKDVDYSINLETGVITPIGAAITSGSSLVANYQSGVDTTTVITNDPTLETPNYPDPELVLLDIYKPKSTDREGLYIAIKSNGDFTDTGIFARESGGTFQQISVISSLSTVGTISNSLPLVTGEDLTSTLTIVLDNGTIDPLSDTDYGNNVEVLLIGDEQVCIKNKTLTAPNTYSCTTIKRALNGTVPASHAIGTRVIMLKGNNDLPLIELPSTQIGKTLEFKAVVVGKTISQVATQYSINFTGNAWECLPVSNVTATKDQGGNIYIDWTGNNRGTGLVLPEKYEIDIIDSGVIRTLETSVSNCVYSYTDQVTDFGSIQSTIEVIIYQVSSEVGRGIPYAISLTPSLVSIIPTITDFSPRSGLNGQITIYGNGFTGSTDASINGVSITSFTVVSDGVITGDIPTATTGKVTVTNSTGTGESLTDFFITSGSVSWGEIGGTVGTNPSLEYQLLKTFWIYS